MPNKAHPSGSAHVLDLRKATVAGSHLQAANEPFSDAALAAADLERDTNKGQRLARRNDAIAAELQLNGHAAWTAALRFSDGMPPIAEG